MEQPRYILLGFTTHFTVFSMGKLVPYVTKPICVENDWCPTVLETQLATTHHADTLSPQEGENTKRLKG